MSSTAKRLALLALGASVLLAGGIAYVLQAAADGKQETATRADEATAEIAQFEAEAATSEAAPTVGARGDQQPGTSTGSEAPEAGNPTPLASAPEILFVSRVPGDDYGRLGIRHGDGTRTLLEPSCERVHIANERGVCMSSDGGVLPTYTTSVFTFADGVMQEIASNATTLPSRARMSPGGTWAATTSFVSGTSYEDISANVETVVNLVSPNNPSDAFTLSNFTIDVGDFDRAYVGRQFWGPSFVDDDDFFVTGVFATRSPEIMRGSMSERVVRPTGFDGSCPSVSPDGSTMIVKRPREDGSGFELFAIDLSSGEGYVLPEDRSVDDQVEWLDDDTILYALHKDDVDLAANQPGFDIWALDVDADAVPELFLPSANSPATLRRTS